MRMIQVISVSGKKLTATVSILIPLLPGLGCGTADVPEATDTAAVEASASEAEARTAGLAQMFRTMEEQYATRVVRRGENVSPLETAPAPFEINYEYEGALYDLGEFLERTDTTGLIVVYDGTVLYEGYFMGAGDDSRFTSWSVAKSFVSTLVGMALDEGKIAGIDDPVTTYLPELAGTGYSGVSIRHIMQMSSGIDFVEEYDVPDADVTRLWNTAVTQEERVNDVASSFGSAREAGTRFYYASNDTQILGMLLRRVYGRTLAELLSEELWVPLGMESDAAWITDREGDDGVEMAFCCLNATLRDYARFGLLMAREGVWQGQQLLPAGWAEEATRPTSPQVDFGQLADGYPLGYGYQWWSLPGDNHPFTGQGVYGQLLMVDPVLDLVVVKTSAWPVAWDGAKERESYALFRAIAERIRERGHDRVGRTVGYQ
jgi:CubicO group peptidase (beta-lactamase class C family)